MHTTKTLFPLPDLFRTWFSCNGRPCYSEAVGIEPTLQTGHPAQIGFRQTRLVHAICQPTRLAYISTAFAGAPSPKEVNQHRAPLPSLPSSKDQPSHFNGWRFCGQAAPLHILYDLKPHSTTMMVNQLLGIRRVVRHSPTLPAYASDLKSRTYWLRQPRVLATRHELRGGLRRWPFPGLFGIPVRNCSRPRLVLKPLRPYPPTTR